MDEEKIRQAKNSFDSYILDGLLKKETFNSLVYRRLYDNSIESLNVADKLLSDKTSSLWAVVSSYYSMFYMASAYIYKRGYKAQHQIVHKIINDALIVLARDKITKDIMNSYEEEKDKALSIAETLLDNYGYERMKRSRFQYELTEELKESKAKTSLIRAKEFVTTIRKLLD